MNETQARYAFLPWMRRGVSTGIERVDGSGPVASRSTFPVTIVFNGRTQDEQVTVNLALHGPGEIAGIDRRMIIRTDPAPDVMDTESNYFPLIEFHEPDFPWRYTPASANAGDRLRPWIALIVLADDEIAASSPADNAHHLLPTVTLSDSSRLPNLAQSWAWAHVQVTGLDRALASNPVEVAKVEREEPHRTLSRLLCARHLQPRTAYTAFVVPTFERGRLAGLNQEIADTIDALAPAWEVGRAGPVVLPVYHQWRFQTADTGDFESLVRELLPPRILSEEVGRRPLDATAPGAGLPPATRANGSPLLLEGALMSPACRDSLSAWTTRQPFVGQLAQLLNRPTELLASENGSPALAPPLYGRWPAARRRLEAALTPSWFDEVNSDPQLRVVAGVGTQVVQEQQEQLMAAAWEQVEGILAANQQLREAELGCAVAGRLVERDLLKLEPGTLVQITAPILARIMASPRTIHANLKDSPVARGALQSQFRQVTRPFGRVGRIQARASKERGRFGLQPSSTGKILEQMNRGELPHLPPPAASHLPSIKKTFGRLAPTNIRGRRYLPAALGLAALLLLVFALFAPSLAMAVGAVGLAAVAAVGARAAQLVVNRDRVIIGLQSGLLSSRDVTQARAARGFQPHEHGFEAAGGAIPARQAVANFQTAFSKMADRLAVTRPVVPAKRAVDFAHLRSRIMSAVQPARTIPPAINGRLNLPDGTDRDPSSGGPVMIAPAFDQPMYEPLRDLSQEWLLPGVDKIPANTVSLLVANQRFIESYLLGLNHEMARELLWREFPTDQRGTCFRQFWDVRGYAGPAGTDLSDIAPVHEWPRSSALGSHRSGAAFGANQLVLLVRGRLLRRYPHTVLYAVRATLDGAASVSGGGRRIFGSEERYPLFFGTLEADVAFVGFDLRREEVMGDDNSASAADQGWFFVFQEQPSAPRFGLEVPRALPVADATDWANISWSHLVRSQEELEAMTYIDLDPPLRFSGDLPLPAAPNAPLDEPNLVWHASRGARSADLASITLRKPFRVGIHGSDMLPPA